MLDQTKFRFIELDLPNILCKWGVDREIENVEFRIDNDIKPFIVEAAKKYPMWQFIAVHHTSQRRSEDNAQQVNGYSFYVYEDREKIGELSTEYSRAHNRVYCIYNERISNSRERGTTAKTKDINKALKLLAKNFGAKTLQERLHEAHENCGNMLDNATRVKSRTFVDGYTWLTNSIIDHIMGNWDITKEIAKSCNADLTKLDALPVAYEDFNITREVEKCYENGEGVVVTIHGNDYAVKDKEGITIYGTENLPVWIKRGVGMLKLVEPQHIIGKVGIKINEQSFFVMKGTNDE